MISVKRCVLFGGTGFIGSHFARTLLDLDPDMDVILADAAPPRPELLPGEAGRRVRFVRLDVRRPLDSPELPSQCDLVANFAAVHREPGHEPREYWETNLLGAEHVCAWAEAVDCRRMIFTSSISPYGPCEEPREETALPCPATAYGGSKLAAEKIHEAWRRGGEGRKLLVVRPGVVWGPGEGGNVTRMLRAALKGYFFFMGNRQAIKAGGYVKELCRSMLWGLERLESGPEDSILYNFTLDPPPRLEEYVTAQLAEAGRDGRVRELPYSLLLAASYVLDGLAKPLGVRHPFSPVRIRKLVRSNNIQPGYLRRHGYQYRYSLREALRDWKNERPDEWPGA